MQFIETNELKPGMRLAKPIYSKTGVMLYDRDTKLSLKGIESIKNFHLIGIYILEPAEPLPPLTKEDLEFEQFQTMATFQIQDIMEAVLNNKDLKGLHHLAQTIIKKYGSLDHKMNFAQPLRSAGDYAYKHANSVALLTAIICHGMNLPYPEQFSAVCAALLYDIGYLFVESNSLLSKGKPLTQYEEDMLQKCRRKGLDKLNEHSRKSDLPGKTLEIITQVVVYGGRNTPSSSNHIKWLTGARVLQVADLYDRMTAMSLETTPVSVISAVRHLMAHPEFYDQRAVTALISSIQLLPKGSCVDLSTNEQGLVLEENPDNFMQPLILNFSNNLIYDLSDPEVSKLFQVTDIMKTMDNRIRIDAETLSKFTTDKYISEQAQRYRKKKNASAAKQDGTSLNTDSSAKKTARRKLV